MSKEDRALAQGALERRDYAEAIRVSNLQLDLHGPCAAAYLLRAAALFAQGSNTQRLIADCTRAGEADPLIGSVVRTVVGALLIDPRLKASDASLALTKAAFAQCVATYSNTLHSDQIAAVPRRSDTAPAPAPAAAEPTQPEATMKVVALGSYDATDDSQISFKEGDIITVLNQDPSGWWEGSLGDSVGWFPSNFGTCYYPCACAALHAWPPLLVGACLGAGLGTCVPGCMPRVAAKLWCELVSDGTPPSR